MEVQGCDKAKDKKGCNECRDKRRGKGQKKSCKIKQWAGIICVLLTAAVSIAGIVPSFVALAASKEQREPRVYDQAGLFSAEEKEKLEQELQALREDLKMDVALVTTEDAQGKTAEQYADDFYDDYGLGTGKDYSGVLCLMDMDNRELYISTGGEMIRYLTDERIENMLDNGIGYMKKQSYMGCARQFLRDVQFWYEEGIPQGQYNVDRDTGEVSPYRARPKRSIRWYEFLLAFGISAFCGGSVCGKVKRDYAMNQERRQAANFYMAYRADACFRFKNQSDVMTNSHTTRQMLPRSTSMGHPGSSGHSVRSTTHHSGSGRSHGGGGRRF